MRTIQSLTQKEIDRINNILHNEYHYWGISNSKMAWKDIEYQCFSKSHAIYSGYAVIKVYKYLLSIGIDVLKGKNG